MDSFSNFELDTGRIILSSVSEIYKEDIFREFDAEITLYMHPRPATKIEDTEIFIHQVRKDLANGLQIVVCVLKSETREFLGCAGLHDIKTDYPELGIWIKKSAHGNGYGFEAMEALKKWADENLVYKFIKYPVDKRNTPSKKIPQKLGGVIGRVYEKCNLSGNMLDIMEYHIFSIAGSENKSASF